MKFTRNTKCFWVSVLLPLMLMPSARANSNSGPVSASDQQVQATDLVGKQEQKKVDLFTGSFGYSIPISCAPARNGSQPNLALIYSSAGDNGWCGMGWDLNIGYVERNTRDGFPVAYSTSTQLPLNQYDDSKGFILNLSGKESKLFAVATNANTVEYRAEVDTEFLRCLLDTANNNWTVYDKSGDAYYFGETASSQVANPKSGWNRNSYTGTFRWALDQVVTPTGDWTTVAYASYTSPNTSLPERTLYPTQISYNGHTNVNYSATFAGPNTITFQTELRTNDWRFSYRWGFRTEQCRRLTNIVCQTGSGSQNVWSYSLKYAVSAATSRSLLTNVIVYGYDVNNNATAYLTNTFAYQGNPNGVSFGSTIVWTNLILNSPDNSEYEPEVTQVNPDGYGGYYTVADLVDIDGDGLPDRLNYDSTTSPNQFVVQKNLGMQGNGYGTFTSTRFAFGSTSTGTGSPSTTNPLPDGTGYAELNSPYGRFRDLDGDGLPDRVMDCWGPFVNGTAYTNFTVMLNSGNGFSSFSNWAVTNAVGLGDVAGAGYSYECVEGGGTVSYGGNNVQVGVGLFDLNGDGRPDRVMTGFASYISPAPMMTNLYVLQNTGTNFTRMRLFPYKSQNWNGSVSGQDAGSVSTECGIETVDSHFMDLNGDGLPDHIMWPINSSGQDLSHSVSYFAVEYNDGYSCESTNTSTSPSGAADRWPGVVAQANNGTMHYNTTLFWSDAIWDLPFAGLWDVNGDGLPDRVVMDQTTLNTNVSPAWLVYLNNGHGFNTTPIHLTNIDSQGHYNIFSDVPWWSPQGFIQNNNDASEITTLMDINGDGLLDRVMAVYYSGTPTANYFLVQLNQGPFPDLLTNINNGIGGNIGVSYDPSTAYDNRVDTTDPNSVSHMPYPRYVTATMTSSDGINPPQTTSYGYGGGFYDGIRREFHGFAVVTNTDPTLRSTVTYFHTGGGRNYSALGQYSDSGSFAKAGMPYRIETYGNDNTLYHLQINQVDQFGLGFGRYFPFTTLTADYDYPGPKITVTDLAYDFGTGNLTNRVEYGQVNSFNLSNFSFTDTTSADNRQQHTIYAIVNNNNYIVDHPGTVNLTDGNNNVVQETKYTYNSYSGTLATKLTRIASGYYATNTYGSYTTYGLVGLKTDSVGVQTTITYDSTYNTYPATTRIRVTPGSDNTSDFIDATAYDARSGALAVSTDPAGITVSNSFDAFCRLKESDKIPAGGGTAIWMNKIGYNLGVISAGNAVSYVAQTNNDGVGGFESRTYLDGFGRAIQTRVQGENGNYRVVSTGYDGRGNAFLTTWPVFGTSATFSKPSSGTTASWIGYDAAGRVATNRPVNVTFNNGAFSSKTDLTGDTGSPLAASTWNYVNGSSDPWWIIVTDEDGKVRKYGLDAFGRTNQIQEVDGTSTYTNLLKYDLADNLTNIVNANGENIYWAYNDAGGLAAMADPYLGQWTYVRDYAGRLRVQTDGRGNVVSNSYVNPSTGNQDALGRVRVQTIFNFTTNRALVPAYTNTYTYDSSDNGSYTVYKGLLYKVADSEGAETNGYDIRERLAKTTRHLNLNNQNYATAYTYDDGDKVTSTAYPNNGPTVTNTYWHGGSINQVSRFGDGAYYTINASSYDEFGHVTQFSYGNGLTTTNSYYSVSKRLKTISAGASGAVFSRTFTYSNSADIASISGTGITGTMGVTYDNLHRIKTYSGLAGSYGYDHVGNITTNVESGAPQAYDYGVRRGQAVKTVSGKKYLYDLCGNMIVRKGGDTNNSQSLAYDAENRLVRVAQAGTNFMLVKFGYAANGTRLWKWNNQSPTNLQVWIGNIYEEKQGKVLSHVYAGGQQVCTFETNSPLFGGTDTNRVGNYYHEDNLNSSSALSSSGGAQQEVNVYYPFGRVQTANPQASFKVSRQFTGQIKDDETGLYYYNARYYDAEIGRFVQPDTVIPDFGNPQSYNRYSYVQNNPLRYTDPTGHSFKDYVLGLTGLASFSASSEADTWAKGIGNRGGNLGFKSFADAQSYLADQKDPAGLNADVRLAQAKAAAVSVTVEAAVGMAKTEIAAEAAIVAPEAKAMMEEAAAETAAKEIRVSKSKYPESVQHLDSVGGFDKPLTVDRAGAAARRSEAMKSTKPQAGLDRDEAPPAMFKEGSQSVKPIKSGDNRGAGAVIGNSARSVPEGGKVILRKDD